MQSWSRHLLETHQRNLQVSRSPQAGQEPQSALRCRPWCSRPGRAGDADTVAASVLLSATKNVLIEPADNRAGHGRRKSWPEVLAGSLGRKVLAAGIMVTSHRSRIRQHSTTAKAYSRRQCHVGCGVSFSRYGISECTPAVCRAPSAARPNWHRRDKFKPPSRGRPGVPVALGPTQNQTSAASG